MANKAYHILTFIFVLLLSGCLIHSATAARALTEGIDVATLVGDKNTLGTRGEPYRRGTTSPYRGEPYTGRGTPRGNPYTRAPAPGIPATSIPSEPAVNYRTLNPNRPAAHCRYYKSCRGGGPPGKP